MFKQLAYKGVKYIVNGSMIFEPNRTLYDMKIENIKQMAKTDNYVVAINDRQIALYYIKEEGVLISDQEKVEEILYANTEFFVIKYNKTQITLRTIPPYGQPGGDEAVFTIDKIDGFQTIQPQPGDQFICMFKIEHRTLHITMIEFDQRIKVSNGCQLELDEDVEVLQTASRTLFKYYSRYYTLSPTEEGADFIATAYPNDTD